MRGRRRAVVIGAAVVVAASALWFVHDDGSEVTIAGSTSTTATSSSTTTTSARVAPKITTTSTSTTTTTITTTTVTARPPTTTVPTTSPPPVPGSGRSLYVLGDSVLLGAGDTVPAALPGWIVTMDTVGSRRLPQGIEVLRAKRAQLGAVVVIQQGNNFIAAEGSFAAQIDEAMRVLQGVPRVVWLTVAERWPSRVTINQAIRAAPSRWPNAVVADWAALIAAHPEYAGDLLHLSPAGRIAIAELIASKVGPAPR